jgi:hypothetical protein
MGMHRLKTSLGNESNILRNRHTYVARTGVYEDLKPRVNMHSGNFGAAGKRPALAFVLGESVDAVPDCPNQYSNNNERDDGSSLALPSNLLKHSLLASLGQALPVHL